MEPQKLGKPVRDQIRCDLLDAEMLAHLEGCGSINWNVVPTWQCQRHGPGYVGGIEHEWEGVGNLAQLLEVGCGYYIFLVVFHISVCSYL